MKLPVLTYFCLWSVNPKIKAMAQTCGAWNDSCPSTGSSEGYSSPKQETRLVPVCITRREENGNIQSYETRCVEEERDPRLSLEDSFECGCCTFEQEGLDLPDFCGTHGPTPAPEIEICEDEVIFCAPDTDDVEETENDLNRRALGESLASWERYRSDDSHDEKRTKMNIRRNRILTGQMMSTKTRRAQAGGKLGSMSTPLVAICAVKMSISGIPTFETRCVAPTEALGEEFTCGCCEGEEDLCIVPSDMPSLTPSFGPTTIGWLEPSLALLEVRSLQFFSYIYSFLSSLFSFYDRINGAYF